MIRVGVVGAGYWGPNLVRTLADLDDVRVIRVADMRAGRRELIAKRFPWVETTASHEDVVLGRDIDAVFIATPPETHCPLAIRALEAGKHVFVEKPLATCVADAEEMVSVAERCDRRLAVGHLFLFHPAIVAIRKMLDRRELGDIYFLSSTRSNLGPPNAVSDVVWDLAPHDISILLHLLGEMPAEITARGASFTHPELIETAYINLGFPSGRMAQVNVSWLTPNKTRRLELVCSKKTVVYDDTHPSHKLQICDAAIDNRKHASDDDAAPLAYGPGSLWLPALSSGEPLRAECEHFIACIRDARTPINSGRSALDVVRVLEAASGSIRGSAQRMQCAVLTEPQ